MKTGEKHEDGIIISITDNEILICKENDEPYEMSWHDAMNLGGGWRLPTIEELRIMFDNRKILNMNKAYYWSSTEYFASNAWRFYFFNGNANSNFKPPAYSVRAVRALPIQQFNNLNEIQNAIKLLKDNGYKIFENKLIEI